MSTPSPVLICGKHREMAEEVRESMMPEYEIIHVILSIPAGISEIPVLLRGEIPSTKNELGTGNYAKPPVAIVLGGEYNDEAYKSFREACDGVDDGITWLRVDKSHTLPAGMVPGNPGMGNVIAKRMKTKLESLKEEGKMGKGGLYWF